jgi:hypothetical protein
MENVLRYFFFDVLPSAGLPVAAAYIANWAVVNRFRIHGYLGDGQLCFYATTLSVVTTSGLFAIGRALVRASAPTAVGRRSRR